MGECGPKQRYVSDIAITLQLAGVVGCYGVHVS